jgi:hypothetical protein
MTAALGGFRPAPGSALLRQPADGIAIPVAMGAVDRPSGLGAGRHVFTAGKGDRQGIAGGLPRRP